jgi:NAD(P)-dependent dehydrogenase (short-subunit alcohol dehydrogenase family)
MSRSEKTGRVALVTGAATGIGRAHSERLAADGAAVVVVDIVEPEATVAAIIDAGGRAMGIRGDLTDPTDVARCHAEVRSNFDAVDILVNNIGTYPVTPFDELTLERFHEVLSINLDTTFLMCKQFAPDMRSRGWGRIINTASRTVWLAAPHLTAYMAAKAAVIGLSRALASDLGGDGVTVNVVAPGLTRTGTALSQTPEETFDVLRTMQAIKRSEEPDDLVGTVSFLASDDAAYITGQTIMVDGGLVRL